MGKHEGKKPKVKDSSDYRNQQTIAKHRKFKKKKTDEKTVEEVEEQCKSLLSMNVITLRKFSDIPLSTETLQGLDDCEYEEPTEIQRDSLPYTLTGHDVVGAAKTGSGKTLALVIPLLESLWKARWVRDYGLGALIISPTRELALQTFTCINHVGKHHNFSCALLIGGTDVSYEKNRLAGVNIIVCTPGRLLQHMDENENFTCDQVQMLVLDEADRMLDMGFSKQLNSIVANLPRERQTLLFSATQTKNVKDLTRVCTKDPVFVSVHENATNATPDELQQSYLVCEEHEKMNTLWSFIRNHRKLKTLVFVSSCKQARFLTDAFCHLRPGVPVMGLWGTMNQSKRVAAFQKFEDAKCAVMIATDVASRGLDFSDVDWVVQMDAPAAEEDYIHRVGRTARMKRKGQAVLFLTPYQEKGIVALLKAKNIHLNNLQVDPSALTDIRVKLQAVLAQFTELNQFAQKSIVGYLRSIYLMKDKNVFNVESIDAAALADSYGLVAVPRVRFLSKKGITLKGAKTEPKEEHDSESENEEEEKPKVSKSLVGQFATEGNDDDLFTVKKTDVFNVLGEGEEDLLEIKGRDAARQEKETKVLTKTKAARKMLNKGVVLNTKKVFDEEGEVDQVVGPVVDLEPAVGLNIEEAKSQIKAVDKEDRQRMKEKRKQKKALEKKKAKAEKEEDLDLQDDDDAGSGINSDADLDWLPDPDEVRKRYAEENEEDEELPEPEEPAKKRRKVNKELRKAEDEALALLNPF